MSSNNAHRKVVSVDKQGLGAAAGKAARADENESATEAPQFRPSVDQEIQAKVDANHPDGIRNTGNDRIHGVTLEQEERITGREAELERISANARAEQPPKREVQSRFIASKQSTARRREFQKRAASVDPQADPDRPDPRVELPQEQLAAVNEHSHRLADKLDGWSRAAISRRLAAELVEGTSMMAAVVGVYEELRMAPGQVIPIGTLEDVDRREVRIEGEVQVLWEPADPSQAQVGLIADDSGKTKFTVWKKSNQPHVSEGETVRIHKGAVSWYDGRVSVTLTGWSEIHFPEREQWLDV